MLLPKKREIVAEGEQTVLRRFDRHDVDRWVAWPHHLDPLFAGYNPPALTLHQRDTYFRTRQAAADLLQFAVDDLRGQLVGRISLREIDWRERCAVLGLTFHPRLLGRGLGTDALTALLGHYFGSMDMETLLLDVAAYNQRAYRCYHKCGFRVRGHHWGESQPDYAGVMRRAEYAAVRHLFRYEQGLIRPLLIDMYLRREDYIRR
jgi:diamine N-acetyltransferase